MTTASPTTLAVWLPTQIAADEEVARMDATDAWAGSWWADHMSEPAYNKVQATAISSARRVLAECEAKRQIVEGYKGSSPSDGGFFYGIEWAMSVLALPYADRDGYQETWRP